MRSDTAVATLELWSNKNRRCVTREFLGEMQLRKRDAAGEKRALRI